MHIHRTKEGARQGQALSFQMGMEYWCTVTRMVHKVQLLMVDTTLIMVPVPMPVGRCRVLEVDLLEVGRCTAQKVVVRDEVMTPLHSLIA